MTESTIPEPEPESAPPPDDLSRDLLISKAIVDIHKVLLTMRSSMDEETRQQVDEKLTASTASLAKLLDAIRVNVEARHAKGVEK